MFTSSSSSSHHFSCSCYVLPSVTVLEAVLKQDVANPVSLPSRGRIQVLCSLKLIQLWGRGESLVKKNKNYEYKIGYESEYLFRAPSRALKGPFK
jgi:hypothetical protein